MNGQEYLDYIFESKAKNTAKTYRHALKNFAGYKVWICGDKEGGAGKGRFQLDVKGYGVLGPAERGR